QLPFPDGVFDACTVAFGLRNMPDYRAALTEMGRVLRPGGRLVCLELTPMRRPVLGGLFAWYFAHAVPLVGGILSGDRDAYRYLPQSVAAFPDAATLAALMRDAGFAEVTWNKLGAGTVALHVAGKARM
ncbi:MAG TPA: class I SAM-dependent methyltransferase, partial [Thermomicrobiales bacterium]|nr:class I SAM-dependent methyltransferase [Thermomicrobiales bacterium]